MENNSRRVIGRQMSYLLVAVIILMTYILQQLENQIAALDIVFAIVILATIYVAGSERRWLTIAIIIAIPTLAISLFSSISDWPPDTIGYLYLGLLIAFITFAIIAVIREILLADRVTVHTISGAMVVYLLIALVWALLYVVAEGREPGSFSSTQGSAPQTGEASFLLSDLAYFSLITVTSVGYGDITPISDTARSLASLEAVFGQVFLAVLVAWLVGKYISHSEYKESVRE
jgi:Ion channel